MKIKNTLIVFDLESTGIWIEKDRILEIAIETPERNDALIRRGRLAQRRRLQARNEVDRLNRQTHV